MMLLSWVPYLLAGLLIVIVSGQFDRAACQDFPYSVPQAPEFDGRGNYVRKPDPGEPSVPKRTRRQSASTEATENNNDYRIERPYMPEDSVPEAPAPTPRTVARSQPVPPQGAAAPPGPGYGPPPQMPPPGASVPQQPGQVQNRQDCSQYPMLIARSQSESEMRLTAQRYFACLLNNGWDYSQAKQHIINTLENMNRAGR